MTELLRLNKQGLNKQDRTEVAKVEVVFSDGGIGSNNQIYDPKDLASLAGAVTNAREWIRQEDKIRIVHTTLGAVRVEEFKRRQRL